jgi:hypothetical protein
MEAVQRTLEIERVVNLVKGFGWSLIETKVDGDIIKITIEKKVESVSVSGS